MSKPIKPTNIHVHHEHTFGFSVFWMFANGLGDHLVDKAKWDERMKQAIADEPRLAPLMQHTIDEAPRNAQATTSSHLDDGSSAIVFYRNTEDNAIVHEVMHAVFHAGRHLGIHPCEPTEEWYCYTVAAIVQHIQKSRS